MPGALLEARRNLDNPPKISTEIAIEQLDGSQGFFKTAVAEAFPEVKDKALLDEFKTANDAVIAALGDYKKWLQDDLLKRSNGDFAIGADTYAKKLAADEMIELPLDELLAIAEKDLRKNQAAFAETAKTDRPDAHAAGGPGEGAGGPSAGREAAVGDAGRARRDRPLHDRPPHRHRPAGGAGARAGDAAIPARDDDGVDGYSGPVREGRDRGVLQHDAAGSEVAGEGRRGVHDAVVLRGDLERVGARGLAGTLPAVPLRQGLSRRTCARCSARASNSEGWAHYCEQMVIDEGFHADDPRYRLAQIQDALLRDARFIAGIRMHTKGMTVAQAEEFFVKDGYQPRPVARSESKRGTSDPTYGYYTMGKLMILKLRDDYKAKQGAQYLAAGVPRHVHPPRARCRCRSFARRCWARPHRGAFP